ncbi:MAG TPA: hypothetical protein VF816_10395 [Rhodocyclaceae bacterium]
MGCLCNQKVQPADIPPSIVGPMLMLAGGIGLAVDYLGLGDRAPWWYGAALLVGTVITVRSVRAWKKRSAPADS